MPTDTSEKRFETRVCTLFEKSDWLPGTSQDYDPTACVDLAQLSDFLNGTQPETAQALQLHTDNNTRWQSDGLKLASTTTTFSQIRGILT